MSGVTSASTVGHQHPVVADRAADRDPGAARRRRRRSSSSPARSRPSSMRALTSVASSSGSPTTSARTPSPSRARKPSAIERCTKTRCTEMHDWPAKEVPATAILSAAASQSADGLDDHRRVVAELEPDPLVGHLLADAPPDGRRAGEGDHGDVGMLDEVVGRRALAGHHVEPAVGEAAVVDQHLGQRERRERGRPTPASARPGSRRRWPGRSCGPRGSPGS